ncbi:Cof-type HAD-IIB family hydrolase [Siminovitchia fortis]|uniref:Cof-type HAD-IIB family hydrolase n=1 Tax=Siminovitchia fortis TaxID=254758 RepID=A0A451GBM5_9BACI|nr:Cof-type HAD-IIB family hydrolase [Siminovitchia fortis]RWR12406.1 Cof-type HAD-IIB family hydrolase [Siminovitchia fortis]WHY83453.1 Cof-type HAD-IIB family hydrolase [Siminovitchia fortis]
MNKIVFFDIDGTLLDGDKNLPASAKEAVHTLQKNGIYTAIATGRAPFMISSLLKELNIDSYVCFNGQYVVFENKVIAANAINKEILKNIEKTANRHEHALVYMNEATLKTNTKNNDRVRKSLGTLKLAYPDYDPEFYTKKDIYQALLFTKENEAEYLSSFHEVSFIRWHELALDIVPKGGSKARGIRQLIKRLGFKMEDVYAFGDGMNDIEMLREVGTGVAMGNAHDVVKEHADIVTTDVENDGIVNGLKEVGLLAGSFETMK